jgi:hypothetical protein
LRHCGYQSVVYEPEGNTTPGFLIDGSIAVEVRRLNAHHFGEGAPKGLEQVANSLWRKVRALLEGMGPPTAGESWFIHHRL